VQSGYDTATEILTRYDAQLEALTAALLEKEKIDFDELVKIMGVMPANKLHWPKQEAQAEAQEAPCEPEKQPQDDDSVGA
jgi:hypothetical protein